jgi:Rieske Fe-S protein
MTIAKKPSAALEPAHTDPRQDAATGTDPGQLSRRNVLRAAALAGAGASVLVACGSSSTGATGDSKSTSPGGGTTGGGKPTKIGDTSSGGSDGSSSALATTDEVPKGGGLILPDAGVVITQPSGGTFEGFSSTCTHMGCTLDNVSNGTINCICHGSQFSIKNGSVVTGPATVPLPAKPIVVKGKDIALK